MESAFSYLVLHRNLNGRMIINSNGHTSIGFILGTKNRNMTTQAKR